MKMRVITIELPESIIINGATDAPDNLREVKTENWTPEFCLTAMGHGVSQKIGDTWSVSKKDVEKTAAVHANMVAGDWSRRANSGVTEAKLMEKIGKLDVQKLLAALSPEQMAALVAANGDLSVVTTKQP
jgi:hypothetical protein